MFLQVKWMLQSIMLCKSISLSVLWCLQTDTQRERGVPKISYTFTNNFYTKSQSFCSRYSYICKLILTILKAMHCLCKGYFINHTSMDVGYHSPQSECTLYVYGNGTLYTSITNSVDFSLVNYENFPRCSQVQANITHVDYLMRSR